MSTSAKLASGATALAVIGVGWWIGRSQASATVAVDSGSSGSSSAAASSSASASSSTGSATYQGSAESDRYGSLTVTITTANGKLTDITYTSTAHDDKSLEIEKRAIPTLKSEAVKANSADISSVSGATYTSTKYKASLQAALDAAQ